MSGAFVTPLEDNDDLVSQGYRFTRFRYPTKFLEWNPSKRMPGIDECGKSLGDFQDQLPESDQLFLVGHSMGGLVIQSLLAQTMREQRGMDLAKIRCVIRFATANLGSTILSGRRGIFSIFRENPCGVFSEQKVPMRTAALSHFVFFGAFKMTSFLRFPPAVHSWRRAPLSGGHKQILRRGPDDPDDTRYPALKDALPDPVGHPSIYEIDRFAVNLAVLPDWPRTTFTLSDDAKPFTVQTDNVAVRNVQIVFSKQNRCSIPYDQAYRRSCLSPTAVVERAGGKATGRQPDLVMRPFRPRLDWDEEGAPKTSKKRLAFCIVL